MCGPVVSCVMRVKFSKGKQREFLEKVLERVGSPSLGELSRRIDVNYSTMKNYFNGSRFLSFDLFERLCGISGLKVKGTYLDDNWGQVKGGKKGKRKG